ncbi:hypothetical protein VPH35_136894 [Triticum aestivum]
MNSSGVEVLEISVQDSTLYIDSGILTLAGDEWPDGYIHMNCAMNVQPDSNMFSIKYSVEKENLQVNSSLALVESKWWSKKKNAMVLQKAVSSDTSLGASKGVLHSIPGVPVRTAVSWVFSNLSCAEASSNSSDFGCLSENSECLVYHKPDDSRGGYTCQCWHGYEGNPYVQHGCQDIDECTSQGEYSCFGQCINLIGSYTCTCPHGTTGFVTAVGIGSGVGTLLIILSVLIVRQKLMVWKARKSRDFFFKKNRGLLLQQLVDKHIAERMMFKLEELEKATNKFDEARKLGGGGHGTVYKGILSDKRVVAIKKSKVVILRETDDFINEVAILSQVNHRNVVKLFGCLPSKDRLRIALETSRCLAYLHSAASVSIVHRDIKSANVLLDDHLRAKVSDFGASRGIPIDQTGVTTAVQGTFGYLDPEYYHTRRLTEKSDVYSFGVMLVEILTRKKPCVHLSTPGASLTAEFILRVNQDKLFEMLDQQVIEEGSEEAKEVAAVALMCLSLKGEDRPTMRQVETKLEVMQTVENNTPMEQNNANADDDNFSRRYSMEEECMSSMSLPR